MTPRRILWPTDFSPASLDALSAAAGLASATGCELVLAHVIEDPGEVIYGERSREGKDLAAYSLWNVAKGEIGRRLGEAARERLPEGVRFRCVSAFGDPVDRLLEIVAAEEIDLLVISARREKQWLREKLLGTVAYKLVRMAPCDVLVVK